MASDRTTYYRRWARALACAILALALMGAQASAAFKADVFTSSMKVYSRATASSAYYIGSLGKGTVFTVEAYSGDWARISYRGQTGYALIGDMRSHNRSPMYLNRSAHVYQKPDSSSKSLGALGINSVVYVVGFSGSYYLVENKSGSAAGYVKKSYLSDTYTPRKGYTNCATTVYKSASTSRKLMNVAVNTPVVVTGESGDYYRVTNAAGTATGYIRKGLISASKTSVSARKDKAYTNCQCVVYKSASTSSAKMGTLAVNTLVYVTDETGGFYKVLRSDGKFTGYILKGKLSASKTDTARGTYSSSTSTTTMPSALKSAQSVVSADMSAKAKIEYAIYWMQGKLGCPYSSSPNNTTNFDCLGLIYQAYKSVGVRIPNSSYACGYTGNYQTITNVSNLKRGDIVCFNTIDTDSDLSDHVGVYLGEGRFIHASSGAGMVVVSKLNTGYYKERFYCARRVLK